MRREGGSSAPRRGAGRLDQRRARLMTLPSDLAIFGPAKVRTARGAPSTARTVARPRATGRFRFRGAGSSGRGRRRGCRTRRRGSASTWRSTRCASRAGPAPTGRPLATAGSPGLAPFQSAKSRGSCFARRARPRPAPCRRAAARTAIRTPRTSARRSTRRRCRRRPGTHGPVDQPLHQLDASRGCARSPAARRSGAARRGSVGRRQQRARSRTRAPRTAALLRGLDQDLVVDVGDVPDEGDVVSGAQQPAPQHVIIHAGAQVADVRSALHGEPTQVDTDLPGRQRDEVPDRSGRGVVQA